MVRILRSLKNLIKKGVFMKKLLLAVLSLSLLSMLPACCGCNWGCKGKRTENGNGTTKKRTVRKQVLDNNY